MEFIFNKKSPRWKEINSVTDWINSFQTSTKNEKGHSALSLAEFCKKQDFEKQVKAWLNPIITTNDYNLLTAQPEKSSRFDTYSKQRIHDLAINGCTDDGRTIFIGVEAKVNETYNSTLSKVYHKAKEDLKHGKKTNIPQRIEKLISDLFPKITIESPVRYQLLYAIAGTLCENCDYNVLLFLTFKTNIYNENAAKRNKNDLKAVLKYINYETVSDTDSYYICHFGERNLFIIEKTIDFHPD